MTIIIIIIGDLIMRIICIILVLGFPLILLPGHYIFSFLTKINIC